MNRNRLRHGAEQPLRDSLRRPRLPSRDAGVHRGSRFYLLLIAELMLGATLRGLTPKDALLNREPVSGTAYYLSLWVFALMPWCLGCIGSSRNEGTA
jgi:hypothetical protein